MKNLSIYIILSFACLAMISCKEKSDDNTISYTYDFENGTEGWTAGFSDYPADWDEARLEFTFQHTDLPEELNSSSKSLLLSGTNLSDDLFMFLKRGVSGLKASQDYLLYMEVELASQYPEGSIGIGGSPATSVYLKVGGSNTEPHPVSSDDHIRMNIDKGNQSQSGSQMKVIGNVAITGNGSKYELIKRDNMQDPFRVRTGASGTLWLIIGTDSGFEGTTTLYYNRMIVKLVPQT